jgi:hypothetical protein
VWGEPFVEFHHALLLEHYPIFKDRILDISDWLTEASPNAAGYYKRFFSLFLKHGILFENFLLTDEETPFMRQVVLPALIELYAATGKKPLIVNLGPFGYEADQFWISYPPVLQATVDKRLGRS